MNEVRSTKTKGISIIDRDYVRFVCNCDHHHDDWIMFKFDFDIDGAHDLEEISPTSGIQPLHSDKPSLELEPFAEILIDHLVRVNHFKSPPAMI